MLFLGPTSDLLSWSVRGVKALVRVILKHPLVFFGKNRQVLRKLQESGNLVSRPHSVTY